MDRGVIGNLARRLRRAAAGDGPAGGAGGRLDELERTVADHDRLMRDAVADLGDRLAALERRLAAIETQRPGSPDG